MSLPAQSKVLRALQENLITRVGSDKDIKVDVRVLAATNKDLKKEIEAGRFREDLYHRLSVILIHVPPLRERKEDIPLLLDKFLDDIAQESGSVKKKISKEAIERLKELPWTGNIRELRNVIERLVILGEQTISLEDVKKYADY
jgi:transcriptional regulator with GAF, ATPase, and Fis domain